MNDFNLKGFSKSNNLEGGNPNKVNMSILRQTTEGLAYLHEKRIIHRDLKPGNILLSSFGQKLVAKLTDFGISREVPDDKSYLQNLTLSGAGTEEWMGPEILRQFDSYQSGSPREIRMVRETKPKYVNNRIAVAFK